MTNTTADFSQTHDHGPAVAINNLDSPWACEYIRNPYAESPSAIGSFESYIRGHYQEQYIDYLTNSLCNGLLPFTGLITDPDFVTLDKAEIVSVRFYQDQNHAVQVDTVIRANVVLSEYHGPQFDRYEEDFCISGTVIFPYNGCVHFDLFQEIHIYHPSEKMSPLSPYLIPYIRSEEYDIKAEEILLDYYPEAFLSPKKINAEVLAERLGLSVLYLKMTTDGSILGRLFFETTTIEYIGPDGMERTVRIPEKTIVVDYEACVKFHAGKVSQTILHECTHYLEHHNFYCVQYLYNSNIHYLNCGGKTTSTYQDHNSPIYWIEKQADLLAFSMQMPSYVTERVFENFLRTNFKRRPEYADFRMLEQAVTHVADFFGVSRRCAQIRLQTLGYRNLQGLFNFVNGKYIRPYAVNDLRLHPGETLTISHQDAAAEYLRNENFRALLDSGNYVYVEGHFCLDRSKYLYKDRAGAKRLTTYARYHLDECCIIFRVHSNASYSYREGILNKETTATTVTFQTPAADETPGMRAVRLNRILYDPYMPRDFAGSLCYHMDRLKIKKGYLAELTGWDDKTIQRFRNREERPSDIRSIITLCVALQLEPELSMDLLEKAGYYLRNSVEDILYRYIIQSMYRSSLMECNAILTDSGLKPLIKTAAA